MQTRTVTALLVRSDPDHDTEDILTVPTALPLAVLADACLAEAMSDKLQPRVGLDYGHGMTWFVPGDVPGRAIRIPDELA